MIYNIYYSGGIKMLDLKRIRNNPEEIKALMADRGE